jgi:hypothetical protein
VGANRQGDKYIVLQNEETVQVVGRNLGEKGDPGVGIPGENAPEWNPQGAWSSATAYQPLDVVVHRRAQGGDGSAYICLQANSNEPPATEPTYWSLLVETGEQGETGPSGTTLTGSPGEFAWRGGWSSGTSYDLYDIARYENSSYICVNAHTASNANKPGSGAGKWSVVALKGGTGAQGAKGEKGDQGNVGPAGPKGDTGNQGAQGASAPSSASIGPFTENRTLGFVNTAGFSIELSNETKVGTGSITLRQKNGSNVSLPVTLANGDLFEIRVEGVTSGRTYVGYRARKA